MLINKDGANNVLLGGDINYDTTRSSKAALLIKDWLVKMDLCSIWEKYHVDFTHHHINFNSVSIIDQFLISPDTLSVVNTSGDFHHTAKYFKSCGSYKAHKIRGNLFFVSKIQILKTNFKRILQFPQKNGKMSENSVKMVKY